MNKPISLIRAFVSHAKVDNTFGISLVRDLRQRLGSPDAVWYDAQDGLVGGENWWSTIMQEISARNVFIVILSPESMQSGWVKTEIDIAWQQKLSDNKTNKLIVPLLYRQCEVRDDLKTLHMISFEAPRPYQEAFDQLLLALQNFVVAPHQQFTSAQQTQFSLFLPVERLPIWNIPYRRNPFFTGREAILTQLRENLITYRNTALTQAQAISGLGGIGKTQIAVEYAYRYREFYRYVFWLRSTTSSDLLSDFLKIAQMLDLPIKNESDQYSIAAGVKRWLEEHGEWLLIFDNADDFIMVADFFPQSGLGHILLTTRAQATGILAEPLEVEKMDLQEGILLLLRRARLLKSSSFLDQTMQKYRTTAETIIWEVGGLPLAIDQAGAYIEEKKCSLTTYLNLYRMHRKDLLNRRSAIPSDHPDPVASTWALSFQSVEQVSRPAADLLRFCAFLDPDAIPEDLLIKSSSELGSVLGPIAINEFLLNEAIEELLKYSLVRRNANEQLLSVHRLVQAVLKDEMDEETHHLWSERAIRALERSFPVIDANTAIYWQLYLPHAIACVALINQYSFQFPEAVRLLIKTAKFLWHQALYSEAEPLLQKALAVREKVLGPKHPDTAMSLNDLGRLFFAQGKYEPAEGLFLRALTICEEILGMEHTDTSNNLNDLGRLYRTLGNYEQAEPLYLQALAIREKILGSQHPDTANSLNNLGRFYHTLGKYEQAESYLQQALAIREKILGSQHPDIANSLNNLGRLYFAQGEYEQAKLFLLKGLLIHEKALGPEHPDTATSLNDLGRLYCVLGNYEQAELLIQRALAIREKVLGAYHPATAATLNDLGQLYFAQEKYEQAKPFIQRALAIREKMLGLKHPDTVTSRDDYVSLLQRLN